MSQVNQTPSNWENQTRLTTKRLGLWTLAWVLSMAVATFGPTFLWDGNNTTTVVFIVLNMLIGFGMMYAHKEHLLSLDEMQRKVQLESMALALGVAVVVGLAYSNLDIANIIRADAEISYLVMLIGVTYMISLFFANRRYR